MARRFPSPAALPRASVVIIWQVLFPTMLIASIILIVVDSSSWPWGWPRGWNDPRAKGFMTEYPAAFAGIVLLMLFTGLIGWALTWGSPR